MRDTTVTLKWSTDRTLTGTTCSLLLERLLTCTTYFAAILCLRSSGTCSSELCNNYLMDKWDISLNIEDL
jgi:hypothetical protein